MACLIYTDDAGRRVVLSLAGDLIRIGRARDNEIVSRDLRVSRRHAELVRSGGGYLIRDVGSSLGVQVNSRRVEECALADGDLIQLGDTLYTFAEHPPLDAGVAAGLRASDAAVVGSALVSGVEEAARSLRSALEAPSPALEPQRGRSTDEALTRMESSLDLLRGGIERIERARRTMQSLYGIGRILNSSMDRADLLDLIMDLALGVVSARRGFLMLSERGSRELAVKAARNMGEGLAAGAAPPISEGIARRAFEAGEPVLTADARDDERFRESRSVAELDIRSVVCVPLRDRADRPMGVIYVDGKRPGVAFDEEDRDFLLAFADYAAIAIENRRLFEDASARARMEEELRAVRRLDALKSELMSIVAHDVRTPLTSIRSYAEILSEDFEEMEPGRRRTFLERIVREADRLDRLTGDYLDLARIEAGRLDLRLEELEPGALVREACEAMEGQASVLHVRVAAEAGAGIGTLRADRDRLLQVLTNLISNALKFSPEGGEVRAAARPGRTRDGGEGVLFEVTDRGPGMTPEEVDGLFRKFAQVGRAGSGRPRGTGLGLVIVREIVEAHGGRVEVESAPGSGSRFHFTIALAGPRGEPGV